MEDYIIRVTAGNGTILGFFATTKNIANESFKIHKTSPVVSVAMARMLTACSMLGLTLKNDKDLVTLSIKGDGPMKSILTTATSKGNVKGYPAVSVVDVPNKPSGNVDVGAAIGFGNLVLIKDIGLKEPYTGQIPLISGEIADDLTYYFAKSEQIPTSVALSAKIDTDYTVKNSGGFILQLLPGASEETVEILEKKLQTLPPLTQLLDEKKTPEDICEIILGDLDFNINEKIPVKYECSCSQESVEKALISIGRSELEDILETDKKATVNCHFCNKDYVFDENKLKEILARC